MWSLWRNGTVLLAAGATLWLIPLVRFWGWYPEYADRLLIVAVAAGILWQRCQHRACSGLAPFRWLGWLLALTGALLLAVGTFLQAQVSPRPLLLWWLLGSWLMLVAGTVLIVGGPRLLRHLAFPLLFILFALPWPQRLMLPLQVGLQHLTTRLAERALRGSGLPVQRQGCVLRLDGCDLNVVEVCSGIRSLTALLAVAAFLAYWRGLSWQRGVCGLILAVPVIVLLNATRVFASGVLSQWAGPVALQGVFHTALGVLTVLMGVAVLWFLTAWLRARPSGCCCGPPGNWGQQYGVLEGTVSQPSSSSGGGQGTSANATAEAGQRVQDVWSLNPSLVAFLQWVLVTAGVAWLLGCRQQAEIRAEAALDRIPYQFATYSGQELAVAAGVREQLTPDQIVHRLYTDPWGQPWEVWVIFWSSPRMVRGYHHPDVCWPNRGFVCLERRRVSLALPAGTLPITERLFGQGSQQYLVWYWTQEGQHVWTEADERQAQLHGDSHGWVVERLWRREPPQVRARLTVWVGTPCWGPAERLRPASYHFLHQLAQQVYRGCPWATPLSNPSLSVDNKSSD
ncbi:MAG: EpsI family protein [Gemmataceae bacterium]|nr:EpsI family protein [Gemmataceae bacterium]